MTPSEGSGEDAASDARNRTGDEIEQHTREKAIAEMEWAEAEAHRSRADRSAKAAPRPSES